MAGAITAMQALASEAMLEVAMSLKIAARRTRKGVVPPCERCGVDVSVGYSHTDSCTSVEARRLRSAAVPGVIAD